MESIGELPCTYRLCSLGVIKSELAQLILKRLSDLNGSPQLLPALGAALQLPDKTSIAVLPLWNISGDPEQDFFAIQDEITESVIGCIQPEVYTAEHDCLKRKPPQRLMNS